MEYKGYKITIEQDYDPINPRNWDNLCHIIVRSPPRSYTWGDDLPKEAVETIKKTAVISIPLYAFDHTVQHISTVPFNDPWDSWRCGTAYVTEKSLISCFGEDKLRTGKDECLKKALELVENEIAAYDAYISGEVYCYHIEDNKGDFVDGCCGFTDPNDAEDEAKAYVEYFLAKESSLFVWAGIDPWTFEETKKFKEGE